MKCFMVTSIMEIVLTGSSAHCYHVCCSPVLETPYMESTENKENNILQIIGAYLTIIDLCTSYLLQYLCNLVSGKTRNQLSWCYGVVVVVVVSSPTYERIKTYCVLFAALRAFNSWCFALSVVPSYLKWQTRCSEVVQMKQKRITKQFAQT